MGDLVKTPECEIGNGVYSMKIVGPTQYKPVNNSDEEYYCYKASKLVMEGRFAEAEDEYKFAITLGYRKAVMHYATALDMGWIGRQDSELAMMLYRDLAYKRYPIAMYNYGMSLSLGRGVNQNMKRAIMWNDRAADAGLDIAMTQKAIRLAYQSEQPDYKTAFELFSRAAELGDETAMYQIGRFYKEGYYVERDYEKAVLWFRKAIDNGEGCFAEMSLAKCYYSGKGVPKDEEKARELLSQAIEHGLPEKMYPSWFIKIIITHT